MFLTLPPDDVERAKAQAAKLGMTVSGYFSSVLRMHEQPAPRLGTNFRLPSRVGKCIVDALQIARANSYDDIATLMRQAQRILFEEMVPHVPAYEQAADEQSLEEWRTTTTPRRPPA